MPEIAEVTRVAECLNFWCTNRVITQIELTSKKWIATRPNGFIEFNSMLPLKITRV